MFFPALIDNTGLSIAIINYHTDLIKDSFVHVLLLKKKDLEFVNLYRLFSKEGKNSYSKYRILNEYIYEVPIKYEKHTFTGIY